MTTQPPFISPEQTTLALTINPEQTTLASTQNPAITNIPETFPTPAPLETTIAETGFPMPPLNVDSSRDGPQIGRFTFKFQ
jgi:hypothetical protein